MSERIVVLGATGKFGRAAATAFRDAGWAVTGIVRTASRPMAPKGIEVIAIDALDESSVTAAANGADVVLHALNPPYTRWRQFVPRFTDIAVAAARATGASLMFPGNIYNYGSPLPAVIDEETPMRPTSRKGMLRVATEAQMHEAAADGVRTIVVRAGDFFGGDGSGSWFDRVVVKGIADGNITYPGSTDVAHAWAYLPDLAATFVGLAAMRADLPPFAQFTFPGHTVTGDELVAALGDAAGRYMSVGRMPWLVLRLLGPVVPIFGELVEMAYLWREPHRLDGTRLQATIGEIPHTPFAIAIADALAALGIPQPSPKRSGR
jgi:nucleoside-diphosphate-sugar epimerase